MKPLTEKQKRFVGEYLIDLNATQAAIRAGYSKKTARIIGFENLTKPNICRKIEEGRKALSTRTEVSQEMVINELAQLAFSRMGDYATWGTEGVSLVDSEGLKDSACISEVSQTITQHGGSMRIKLHDKVRSLDLLGRHLGLFEENKLNTESEPERKHDKLNKELLSEMLCRVLTETVGGGPRLSSYRRYRPGMSEADILEDMIDRAILKDKARKDGTEKRY